MSSNINQGKLKTISGPPDPYKNLLVYICASIGNGTSKRHVPGIS